MNFQTLPCFKKYPVSMVNCFLFQSFCTVFIHNKRDIYINSANCHFKLCVTYLRTFTMKVWVLVHSTSMNLKRFTLTSILHSKCYILMSKTITLSTKLRTSGVKLVLTNYELSCVSDPKPREILMSFHSYKLYDGSGWYVAMIICT